MKESERWQHTSSSKFVRKKCVQNVIIQVDKFHGAGIKVSTASKVKQCVANSDKYGTVEDNTWQSWNATSDTRDNAHDDHGRPFITNYCSTQTNYKDTWNAQFEYTYISYGKLPSTRQYL